MPIAVRQLGPDTIAGSRYDDDASTARSAPSGVLLPSGGAPDPAPAPAPHRALALDALCILRMLHDRPRDAGPLGEPAFAREVQLVRGQLAPIRTRRALAASFGREACLTRGLRAAYAVRWLELGDDVMRAGWIELVADPD